MYPTNGAQSGTASTTVEHEMGKSERASPNWGIGGRGFESLRPDQIRARNGQTFEIAEEAVPHSYPNWVGCYGRGARPA